MEKKKENIKNIIMMETSKRFAIMLMEKKKAYIKYMIKMEN